MVDNGMPPAPAPAAEPTPGGARPDSPAAGVAPGAAPAPDQVTGVPPHPPQEPSFQEAVEDAIEAMRHFSLSG